MTVPRRYRAAYAGAALVLSLAALAPAWSQGQDGTPAERNAQIIAELLPGRYDNRNQVYFDRRLSLSEPDARPRMHARIAADPLASTEDRVFRLGLAEGDGSMAELLLVLRADTDPSVTRMLLYQSPGVGGALSGARYLEGCDLLWRREAAQFRARSEGGECTAPGGEIVPGEMILAPEGLWLARPGSDGYLELDRARDFSCYIDVPGVGGGREIPYRRYEIADIHDAGGQGWVELKDGGEVGLRLQVVRWPMNNLQGTFTRHSMVLYIDTREDGEVTEVAYGWTVPDATRIGINLKSMLVNCFTLSNEDVLPYFREEPTG